MKLLILSLLLSVQSFAGIKASQGVDAYIQAPQIRAYSTTSKAFQPPANATDLCVIGGVVSGNSQKIVKVHHVRVWGTQTTGGIDGFYLIKRSTFDTGAISTALVAVPHDSVSVASGADLALYTANPTLGTQVGIVRGADVFVGAAAGLANSHFDFNFGPESGTQPIILHANEQLALSWNGNTVNAGLTIQCEMNWTEE